MTTTLYYIENNKGNKLRKRKAENGAEYWQEQNPDKYENDGWNRVQETDDYTASERANRFIKPNYERWSNDGDNGLATDSNDNMEYVKETTPQDTGGPINIKTSIKLAKKENGVSITNYRDNIKERRKKEMKSTHSLYKDGYDDMNIKIRYDLFEQDSQGNMGLVSKDETRRTKRRDVELEFKDLMNDFDNMVDDLVEAEKQYEILRVKETLMAFKQYGR